MRFLGAIAAMAAKEWKALCRDRTVVAAMLVQPAILTLLFGYVIRSEVHDARWVVYDADRTATSRRLVDELAATYELGAPRPATSYASVERLLRRQAGAAALVIPRHFTRALARGEPATAAWLQDGADPLVALRVSAVAREVAGRFHFDEARRALDAPSTRGRPGLDVRRSALFNPTLADLVFFVPTIPAVFFTQLFFGLACFSIVGERERGTYEHVLALPIGPGAVLIGKALPYFAVACGWMFVYYAAADRVFGVATHGSFGLLALATVAFLATSYAIAVLFSTIARNTHQAVYLTVFSVLPSTVISGFLVPTSTMPRLIELASLLLPATHYVTMLRAIVVRGAGVADVALPLGAMGAIFTVVVAGVLLAYPRHVCR